MRRPGQAVLHLQQPEHVGAAADVIDRPVRGVLLAERLPRASLHRPVDRPGKEVEPVAGMPAGRGQAEVDVGLLAGDQEQLVVGEPAALVEHRLHLGKPERAGIAGMAVAVELGQVDHVHAHVLEHPHEVGRRAGHAPGLLVEGGHGDRHVKVAGEGVIAVQTAGSGRRGCTAASPCMASSGRAAREQEEDARAAASVPGGALNQGTYAPPPRSVWRMPKPNRVVEPAMIPAVPDGALVVGQVAREEKLVRGRKAGQGPARCLGDDASGGGPSSG